MNKLTKIGLLAGALLVSTATKSNESVNANYNLEKLIFNPEPVKIELIDSLKIEMPKIKLPKIKDTTDYKTSDFYQDSDEVLLARMLLGECEGCSPEEKIAVAYTSINRINDNKKWNGETLKEVILKPYQYSAFNEGINGKLKDPLRYNSEEFLKCLKLSEEILAGKYQDPLGATHYLNPNHPNLKGRPLPKWIEKLESLGRIEDGFHMFYK